MCGRFVSREQAAIEREYNVRVRNPFERVYNAAPTMSLPVIRTIAGAEIGADSGADSDTDTAAGAGPGTGAASPAREALGMRWGLIPHWWSQPSLPTATINARSEEAAAKPMWRGALRHSRCLVPALGWYEWRLESSGKVPYFIHAPGGHAPGGLRGIVFAGLWSEWRNPAGEPQLSFAILTRAASETMSALHNRMPVVLPPSSWDDWLAPWPGGHADRLAAQVAGSEGNFEFYPVSRYVNAPRNQGERCIEPATTGLGP
jgi:putative SOS response-associated peptidase YedK